jgi:hypothetical protein
MDKNDNDIKDIFDLKKSFKTNSSGLITKIWGPPMWESLHCIAFGYPLKPTSEQKKNYKDFFTNLMNVLPCKFCRDSYKDFVTKDDEPETLLRDCDMENRYTLTKWLYRLHNRVNKKLGMDYHISYNDIVQKYESYRAKCIPNENGCNMPLDVKAQSFLKSTIKHAPVIHQDQYLKIKEYARLRGIIFDDRILKIMEIKDRNDDTWLMRDKKCVQIIKKMRLNGIHPVETEGEYKNLPTLYELKLISLLSTNICCEELDKICELISKFISKFNSKFNSQQHDI